jgi:hypothetical protein
MISIATPVSAASVILSTDVEIAAPKPIIFVVNTVPFESLKSQHVPSALDWVWNVLAINSLFLAIFTPWTWPFFRGDRFDIEPRAACRDRVIFSWDPARDTRGWPSHVAARVLRRYAGVLNLAAEEV